MYTGVLFKAQLHWAKASWSSGNLRGAGTGFDSTNTTQHTCTPESCLRLNYTERKQIWNRIFLWSLSLFNVNIRLDSPRTHLEAMSFSLQYTRILTISKRILTMSQKQLLVASGCSVKKLFNITGNDFGANKFACCNQVGARSIQTGCLRSHKFPAWTCCHCNKCVEILVVTNQFGSNENQKTSSIFMTRVGVTDYGESFETYCIESNAFCMKR